jgi:von Willebrand factor A domain-containing protein 7
MPVARRKLVRPFLSAWLQLQLEFLVSTALAVTATVAFPPWNRTAGFTSRSHQSITGDAFEALAGEFFGISRLTGPMRRALDRIVDANASVDEDQAHSALHFDGESFPEGQARIIALRARVIDRLAADDADGARDALGQALHTVQDFYSHSNWVELGNTCPNPDLGRPGRALRRLPSTTATCIGSMLVTSELTSGYYGGQDRVLPQGKCRHGGPFDSSPGSGGINKDTPVEMLSPHAAQHHAGADLAEQATEQFIRDIKEVVTLEQLRLLFEVGPS